MTFWQMTGFTADPQVGVVKGVPTTSVFWLQFGMHQFPSAFRKTGNDAPGASWPNRIETFLQIFKIHTNLPKSRTKEKK